MPSIMPLVLVLNASYEPITVCSARRAIALFLKGRVFVEESHDRYVHIEIKLPSVIRLKDYRKIPKMAHHLSRRNVLLRDRNVCQYCAKKKSPADLTLDHVLPKSRGGEASWENLVTACYRCNNRKADLTPDEAGMPLLHEPRAMTIHAHRSLLRMMGSEDPKWRQYSFC